jgi:site-specific recombinase XerD
MAGGETMIQAVESYLSVRRAVGYTLSNPDYLLHSFAKFAAARQEVYVRTATAIDWASRAASVAQRHTRYETIRRFADYVRLEDARHEWLPPNQLRHTFAVRVLESSAWSRAYRAAYVRIGACLGRVNINATYWYLESTPELLRDIAVSSESFLCGGQP